MATMASLLKVSSAILIWTAITTETEDLESAELEADSIKFREEDCTRLRRPYHSLSEEERLLYVNGFQALRANGKLEILSTTHAANVAVHKGASFFFLHAYMIWEAETAIRELGGEFECFSMPYWDYTMDSGLEHDPSIFHLDVGGPGDRKHDDCMWKDPLWGDVSRYWSTDADTCYDDEVRNPPTCCLKRTISDSQLLPSTAQIASVFVSNPNFLMFETQIDHYHVWPHFYLAVNTRSQMATAYAVDDPLFFLLHTFTLYQFDLWRSCYEYDNLPVFQLGQYEDAYTPSCNPNMEDCGVVGLDAAYNLSPLDEEPWALASITDITPRKLWNSKIWNVQYDLGSFWTRSKLNEWCESRATHNDVAGPDAELFVDLSTESDGAEMLSSMRSNDLHDFIEETWDELKSQQSELGLSDEEVYYAVESLSCKFHRENGLNSCFDAEDEVMAGGQYETCDSLNIYSTTELTLDDMLGFEGVAQSECLSKRRNQLFEVAGSDLFDESITLKLCNGEYDYFCPDWDHPDQSRLQQTVLESLSRKRFVFDSGDSFNYAVASFAVFALFLGCFVVHMMCCRRKKTLDLEAISFDDDEEIYGTF